MPVITDEQQINELLTRSVDRIYPTKNELKKLLLSGKRLVIYVGIDPTADYVHLGHSTNYLLLERFHKLGHRIIVLVGDFTAMIGDPSDKSSARKQLTREEVVKNLASFKKQIGKILDFEDRNNPIEFKFNSGWLADMTFEDVAMLASNFTVQQMIERDTFQKRLADNKPLYVHEFFYPIMQGYDSVSMNVDIEVGGTDQTFNMLAGRTLLKRYKDKEKIVITTTLFENPETGEKLMSKSLGTGIALNEKPFEMFAGVMRLPDNSIVQAYIDCTRMSLGEINATKRRLNSGENPRDVKLELAHEIVRMYHTLEDANKARDKWLETVSSNKIADDVPVVELSSNNPMLVDLAVTLDPTMSRSQARQLIEAGGMRLDGKKVSGDDQASLKQGSVVQLGKKRVYKISLKIVSRSSKEFVA
jgi:tyrosyl-tRNA synthetase